METYSSKPWKDECIRLVKQIHSNVASSGPTILLAANAVSMHTCDPDIHNSIYYRCLLRLDGREPSSCEEWVV